MDTKIYANGSFDYVWTAEHDGQVLGHYRNRAEARDALALEAARESLRMTRADAQDILVAEMVRLRRHLTCTEARNALALEAARQHDQAR